MLGWTAGRGTRRHRRTGHEGCAPRGAVALVRENVGGPERVLRATIGPALVAWGWLILGPTRRQSGPVALMIMGVLVTETAVTKVCPISAVFGIDTTE